MSTGSITKACRSRPRSTRGSRARPSRLCEAGLLRLDHRRGYRGPILRGQRLDLEGDAIEALAGRNPVPDAWVPGLVLESGREVARIRTPEGAIAVKSPGIAWTSRRSPSEILRSGDIAWFRRAQDAKRPEETYWRLEQEPEIEGAVVVLESATGAIRAMVGGWDFRRSRFNRAKQAMRQVGSSFKPFVFGAALENGFTPADTLFDAPALFPGADGLLTYSPRNYYRRYYGLLTLRRALELSVNVTSVKLMDLVGAARTIEFARRCGITVPLPPYPSLALGAADMLPMEVAAAYAAFANQGVLVKPYLVERVLSGSGGTLEQHEVEATKALEPATAFVLTSMLEGVVDRGTGARLADLPLDIAGKTGTTNDYTDAWFVGYTPRFTMLVWVGYDQKRSLGKKMTGAEAALPIWREIAESGLRDGWLAGGRALHRSAGSRIPHRRVPHRPRRDSRRGAHDQRGVSLRHRTGSPLRIALGENSRPALGPATPVLRRQGTRAHARRPDGGELPHRNGGRDRGRKLAQPGLLAMMA